MITFGVSWSLVALFLGAAFGMFAAKEWRGVWRWLLRFRFGRRPDSGYPDSKCRPCGWDNSCNHPDEHTLRACLRYRLWRKGPWDKREG